MGHFDRGDNEMMVLPNLRKAAYLVYNCSTLDDRTWCSVLITMVDGGYSIFMSFGLRINHAIASLD